MSAQITGLMSDEQVIDQQRELRELGVETIIRGPHDERLLELTGGNGYLNSSAECYAFMRGFRVGDAAGYGRGYKRAVDWIASGE